MVSRSAGRQPGFFVAGLLFGVLVASADASAACTTYWNAGALGDTQVDSIALYDLRGSPVVHVTNARLKRLVEIKNRLTYAAGVKAPLWLCDDRQPAAFAESNLKLIVLSLGMLDLLEWDADAITSVTAHEVAHLKFGHSSKRQSKKALKTLQTIISTSSDGSVSLSSMRGIAAIPLGRDDLNLIYKLLYFKFKREDEKRADDEGMRLMTRIGINPEGAFNAFTTFLRRFGNREGGFLDAHPSLKDRAKNSMLYLSTDDAAKQLTARIKYQAQSDQDYSRYAEELVRSQSWAELGSLTEEWVSYREDSALALYYRGIYQSDGLRQATLARKTFYRALLLDPDNANVRLELCIALFEEGRKLESTYCYRNISTRADKEEFRARTFGENLWVGGEIEPFTSVIATRDESGQKYLTNLEFARQRGLAISNFFGD